MMRVLTSDICLSDILRLFVAYIGLKSRTERPRKTKIGTEVGHVIRDSDTNFKVKRSKVSLQGAGAYCGGLFVLINIHYQKLFNTTRLLGPYCIDRNEMDLLGHRCCQR